MRLLLDVSAVPARPVGAGVYAVNLARALATRSGIDLHLATRHADGGRWLDLVPSATVHPVAPGPRPARLAWEQLGAASLARLVRPDVWHGIHDTMPLRAEVPCVVTVHDLTFFDHPEWHERTKVVYFRRMLRESSRRAAALVAVSEFTARRLEQVLAPRAPVVVAPHGVDHERFAPASAANETEDLARIAALGAYPPYVVAVGTIEPRKDLPTLVRAFAQIADRHPAVRLVVAGGDGWGTEALRRAVERSGVATRIVRPGYVDGESVAALYRRAAVVAYASLEEGFGLPALEALACGAPLVSTLGSAIEEVVGDAALLVPPGDTDAVAAALDAVLRDGAVADALRSAGPVRAQQATWARSADRHLEAYRIALRAREDARAGVTT